MFAVFVFAAQGGSLLAPEIGMTQDHDPKSILRVQSASTDVDVYALPIDAKDEATKNLY